MSEYGRDESAPTPGGVFRGYFVGVRCIINNPFAAKWQAVSSRRGRFIAPAYLYSTCICNPFETHLCNVRNVFVICVLHIRRVKVWFLACKKGVFTLQKYGFCNAKVGILCMLLCYSKLQVYVGAHFYGVCRYVNNRKMAACQQL